MSNILCIDVGTSTVKGACITLDGEMLGFAAEHSLPKGQDTDEGIKPDVWIDRVKQVIFRLKQRKKSIAVAVSGHGPTLIPLDNCGKAIGSAIMWHTGDEFKIKKDRSLFLSKAAWLRERCPKVYETTESFLPCPEYINYFLTGEKAAIIPSDSFVRYLWTEESLNRYGLEKSKFPLFKKTGEKIGTIRKDAARKLGITEGIPVASCGPDFLMSLLGTATVISGRTCDRAGTSEGINHCSDVAVADPRFRVLPHAVEGYFNVAGILSSTGRLFEWYRNISGQQDTDYGEMMADILQAHRDEMKFFPTTHRGASWEFLRGTFIGLGVHHGKRELGQAVVESIGFAVRDTVELIEKGGLTIDTLRVSGGQGKNPIWNQMKSDITGKRILIPLINDGELLGNCICAAKMLGHQNTLKEGSLRMVSFCEEYIPDSGKHTFYSELFASYMEQFSRIITGVNI